MTIEQTQQQNPRQEGEKPPFPEQRQPTPGSEAQMQPQPDYGEQSYKGSGRLAGRAALITGADSGIGRAVALACAREGADVLISYFDEHQDAQQAVRVVQEAGRKAVAVAGDISQEAHCRQLVDRAFTEFGKQEPMGRPAQPAELAPAYVFLASQEASYVAGEILGVTGGKPLA